MKNMIIRNTGLAGLLCVMILPVTSLADSVQSDVKAYLEDKKPQSLDDSPPVFVHVHSKHAPAITESTHVTVLYYFTEADEPQIDDVIMLTNQAVTSAIARAEEEKVVAEKADEDRRGFYITDAVCGSFKGALGSAYKQTTAAWKAVEGGMQATLAAGIEPAFAATVVSRGIDACLNEKLNYEVWMYVQHGLNTGLSGTGVTFSYLASTGAYLLPPGMNGEIDTFPQFDTEVCVENCVGQPPVPPQPPVPSPSPSPSPSSCVSNCL